MSEVTFPGLGLVFHMDRIAFSIGDFHVYWYGVIISFGFVLGISVGCLLAKRFGIRSDDVIDMMILVTPLAIVGARIYYIVFNLKLFLREDGSLNFLECLNVHNGGLAIYGGVITGVLVAILVTRHKKISFWAMADTSSFGIFIGQILGRWGNFINSEAHGTETTLPWRMGIHQSVGGILQYTEVHPTFLYESLWNLVGLLLLFFLLKKGLQKFDGEFFLIYVAWYGLGRSWIEGLRTDSLYFFETGLRTSQLVAFLSFVLALGGLIWKLRQHPDPQKRYVNRIPNDREEKEHGSSDS